MPLFDGNRERMDVILFWVRFLALPPHLWILEVFQAIGNNLGTILDADMSFLESRARNIARIIDKLAPREGLIRKIILNMGGHSF